jgi:hypothetical protein
MRTLVVALNRKVAENSRSLGLDDSGLRLFDPSTGELLDPEEEGHWGALFQATRMLLCSGSKKTKVFEGDIPPDETGEAAFLTRAEILSSRNEIDSSWLSRIRSKIDEGVDEDEEWRLKEKASSIEKTISERRSLIAITESIQHDLEPAMIVEAPS